MALTDQEVEKYVAEIADKRFAELHKATPQETATPAPFTLNIAGKEMTFKDAAEASSVLTNVYQEQARQTPTQVGRTVTSDTDNAGWTPEDQAKYVDMLVKNPMHAQEYIDEKRFGVKNPTQVMKDQMQAVQSMATQLTIDSFVSSHKDYHVSPENAQVMQNVLAELGGGRAVVNPMALEAAFAIADKRGLIKRPEAQTERRGYNKYLDPPPVAGRATGRSNANFEEDAENMSIADLEALLSRSR
jgi:hypothetical protein